MPIYESLLKIQEATKWNSLQNHFGFYIVLRRYYISISILCDIIFLSYDIPHRDKLTQPNIIIRWHVGINVKIYAYVFIHESFTAIM